MPSYHRRVSRFAIATGCFILAFAAMPVTVPHAGDRTRFGPNMQNWNPPPNPLSGERTPSLEASAFTGANIPLGSPNEPTVTVDPNNPMHVAVASYYLLRVSVDGGSSFLPAVSAAVPAGYSPSGDASLGFDSQGRLFWIYLGSGELGQLDVFIARHDPTTGALVSGYPVNVTAAAGMPSSGSDLHDKAWLAVDFYSGSPRRDNLYVTWTQFLANDLEIVWSTRSTNQGATWSAATRLSPANGSEGFPWPAHNAVAPNGDVYVSYHATYFQDGTDGRVFICRSTDGGLTFPQKVLAYGPGDADVTFNRGAGNIPGTRFWLQGSGQAWVLPDPTTAGRIHLVANDDPDNTHGSGDDANVYIRTSGDYGVSWSPSRRVDHGPGTTFQVIPCAGIDPHTGTIVVHWYDNRSGAVNPSGRYMLDVYATSSVDAGLTWTADLKINDTAFDPDAGAPFRFPGVTRIGEYNGVAVLDGIAHADWTGNTFSGSTPVGQQAIYGRFSTVVLSPPGNVSATDGTGPQVTVTWTDVSGEIGYKIYRNGAPTPIGTVGANVTSFPDNSPPAMINTYCVRAYDNFSQSGEACDTGYPQPSPVVATISGPTSRAANQTGTFSVSYTGGIGPHTIQWFKYRDCPGAPGPLPYAAQLAHADSREPDHADPLAAPGEIGPDDVTCYVWHTIGSGGTAVSASDPFDFYIRAVVRDAVGTTGTAQRNVDIPGVPGAPLPAPAGFTATDGTVPGVVSSWAQVLGAEGYRVFRNGLLLATLGQNTFTYTHVNAPPAVATYCVEAYSGSIVSTRSCNTGYPQAAALSVSVSGPTTLSANQVGTWTASVSGGIGPYTYQWAKYRNCPDTAPPPPPPPPRDLTVGIEAVTCWSWVVASSTTASYSTSDPYDFWVRSTITDAVGNVASRTVCINIPSVTGRDPCPGSFAFAAGIDARVSDRAGALVTKLGSVYPNPGRGPTTLEFSLSSPMHVTLVVYDVAGREVARLVDRYMDAGVHSAVWNARGVRSGFYLGRLKTGDVVATRRFMIIP